MKKVFIFIKNIPKYIGQGFIWIYKKCISPFLPHSCKYIPSCSTYTSDSIREWGFFKGTALGIKRILKCNPHSKGGVDPVKTNIKGDYKWLM